MAHPFPDYPPGLGLDTRRIRHLLPHSSPQLSVVSPASMRCHPPPGLTVGRQDPLPCEGVVDDRRRIIHANPGVGDSLPILRHLPRGTDGWRGNTRQFGGPAADEGAVRIELPALEHGVEDVEVGRRVGPCPRR